MICVEIVIRAPVLSEPGEAVKLLSEDCFVLSSTASGGSTQDNGCFLAACSYSCRTRQISSPGKKSKFRMRSTSSWYDTRGKASMFYRPCGTECVGKNRTSR